VHRCLRKEPAERYQSVEDMRKDLEAVSDGKEPLSGLSRWTKGYLLRRAAAIFIDAGVICSISTSASYVLLHALTGLIHVQYFVYGGANGNSQAYEPTGSYHIDGLIRCPLDLFMAYIYNLLDTIYPWYAATTSFHGLDILAGLDQSLGNRNTLRFAFEYTVGNAGFRRFIIFLSIAISNWLYHAILESSSRQATFGKRIMRLRVIKTSVKPITFGQATLRHFSKPLTCLLIFDLARWLISFRRFKSASNAFKSVLLQPIHDKISGCLVVDLPAKRSPLLEATKGLGSEIQAHR
jgi:uncharacterized RDD family membrane protein YckC